MGEGLVFCCGGGVDGVGEPFLGFSWKRKGAKGWLMCSQSRSPGPSASERVHSLFV